MHRAKIAIETDNCRQIVARLSPDCRQIVARLSPDLGCPSQVEAQHPVGFWHVGWTFLFDCVAVFDSVSVFDRVSTGKNAYPA
jgi:hypothetical protein